MPDSDHIDARLDTLFQRSAPPASADFAAQVKARLQAEPAEEDWLDEELEAHLAAWPIEPTADFTPRTLARIEAERTPKIIRFPQWLPLAGAAAAALALAFGALQFAAGPVAQPAQAPTLAAAKESPAPADASLLAARRTLPAGTRAAVPDWDEETAAVLALTDYLSTNASSPQMTQLDLEALALLAAE
ncbi:MAG: hypothetical protein Q7P63_04670 [Verrucomicrobiota bacterium JB022]|nr:hypothetical protein [Verrucomicrobiota bacterium JB022]